MPFASPFRLLAICSADYFRRRLEITVRLAQAEHSIIGPVPKRNRRLSDTELFAFWRATERMK